MILAGIIAVVMLALVMGGPRLFEKVLPERAVTWLESMGGLGGDIATSGGTMRRGTSSDPLDHLNDSADGWQGDDLIAAVAGGGAVFIDAAIAGYSARVDGDSPAQTRTLTPLAGCAPTPPSGAALLAHVRASQDRGKDLGLATYGDRDLAEAAQAFARHYRTTGMKQRARLAGLTFRSFDVAVTEVAKPVHLVLESPGGMTVFNLHLAPGARVERVVLLGGDQVGVANLPEGVPVEVLRGAEMDACGLRPFYPMNPNHLFFQSIEIGAIRGEELEQRKAEFAQWESDWDAAFRAMFGTGAFDSLIGGWSSGQAALVGPLPATPEARAVWAPIEGATVQLTLDQYVEYPGLAAEGADFAARVEAVATAFAWGDLTRIKPGVKF